MRTVFTQGIEEKYSQGQITNLFNAFFSLLAVKPDERHFIFKFASDLSEVWAIIDDYPEDEGGRTATLLLPEDY
jgi:hypothetical protein